MTVVCIILTSDSTHPVHVLCGESLLNCGIDSY